MRLLSFHVVNVTQNLLNNSTLRIKQIAVSYSKTTQQGYHTNHKMSVHEGVKYPCNQCDSKFTERGTLKKHKMSVHQVK